MKRVIQTFHYDPAEMDALGFITDQQKRALGCAAELMDEIRNAKGPFGMIAFFMSEADLFQNHPVTIWSNLNGEEQTAIFEDYILKRLKMREANAEQTRAP